MEEREAKFLNIDPVKMEKKLQEIGAKRVFEKLYKRQTFDYPDFRLNSDGAWVRLRDEQDRITLTFKQRLGRKSDGGQHDDEGMQEIEFIVSGFEQAERFLLSIGLIKKGYQENKRIRYQLKNIEFDIDSWPHLEPYLEIEAPSWEEIDEAIKLLGLNPKEKRVFSTMQIYRLKGIDPNDYLEITFDRMVKREK